MKNLPKRFENAVMKLYNAFHNGVLDYGICTSCAVGHIVGHGRWLFASPSAIFNGDYNSLDEMDENESGYSIKELVMVERKFLLQFKDSQDPNNKESQFKGLCAVIEYLCELDNIPNIMDYTKAFETENDAPKFQLEEILN